jgi:hypothetical protein
MSTHSKKKGRMRGGKTIFPNYKGGGIGYGKKKKKLKQIFH